MAFLTCNININCLAKEDTVSATWFLVKHCKTCGETRQLVTLTLWHDNNKWVACHFWCIAKHVAWFICKAQECLGLCMHNYLIWFCAQMVPHNVCHVCIESLSDGVSPVVLQCSSLFLRYIYDMEERKWPKLWIQASCMYTIDITWFLGLMMHLVVCHSIIVEWCIHGHYCSKRNLHAHTHAQSTRGPSILNHTGSSSV